MTGGCGRSAHKAVRDHRLHARDLTAVLERVAREPAVVVGWSSGGNIALAVAASRPELVRALVVVEAPFHGQRHVNVSVLRTALRLKGHQLRAGRSPRWRSSCGSGRRCVRASMPTTAPTSR
jgi:pimeloyl-ACP methyl ester carboxylesterase